MQIEYTPEFSTALEKLHAGENIFLTGKAGTGKSTLIKEFLRTTNREVAVTAPTGIAALIIGGQTLHRFFGIRPRTSLSDILSPRYKSSRLLALKGIDTLVIDEASMVRADLFDTIVAILRRFGRDPSAPFGGIQIVLVGDLHQLPPVVSPREEEYFRTHYTSPFFFSAHSYSRSEIELVELTKLFRQAGDAELTELLNAVRDGLATTEVRDALNRQVKPGFQPPNDEFWLTLTTTNRVAAARNSVKLDQLPGEAFESIAAVEGDFTSNEHPTDPVVKYKPGAQVMMVANDPGNRWVNGTIGTVTSADETSGRVKVAFRNGNTVWVDRHTWEITKPVLKSGHLEREVTGTFTQLPFRLAWAITIHKSQGQTLDRMVIDLSGGSFNSGQTYVALSRSRSLNGIVLTRPVKPSDLIVDARVVRFLSPPSRAATEAKKCAIAVTTIGDDYFADKARPVEIAVAFEDGTGISTIVNPHRDPGEALTRYGISNDLILIAPTLIEAWAVLGPFVAGHTPVGFGIDRAREVLDHEFKRIGWPIQIPLGTDVPSHPSDSTLRTALEQALRAVERARYLEIDHAARTFDDVATHTGIDAGYVLSRDGRTIPSPLSRSSTANSVLSQSLAICDVAVHGETPESVSTGELIATGVVAKSIAHRMRVSIENVGRLTDSLRERLESIEHLLGMRLLSEANIAVSSIETILGTGVAVCFTGETVDATGDKLTKRDLASIAEKCGLKVVAGVTKKGCNVLVTGQIGTQSGKAKNAKRFSIPVISATEFLEWTNSRIDAPQLTHSLHDI